MLSSRPLSALFLSLTILYNACNGASMPPDSVNTTAIAASPVPRFWASIKSGLEAIAAKAPQDFLVLVVRGNPAWQYPFSASTFDDFKAMEMKVMWNSTDPDGATIMSAQQNGYDLDWRTTGPIPAPEIDFQLAKAYTLDLLHFWSSSAPMYFDPDDIIQRIRNDQGPQVIPELRDGPWTDYVITAGFFFGVEAANPTHVYFALNQLNVRAVAFDLHDGSILYFRWPNNAISNTTILATLDANLTSTTTSDSRVLSTLDNTTTTTNQGNVIAA